MLTNAGSKHPYNEETEEGQLNNGKEPEGTSTRLQDRVRKRGSGLERVAYWEQIILERSGLVPIMSPGSNEHC